ncbi:MAG: ABC transporter permease subunit [Oscillospiraceae bacterium]|nr:ABC transporter permease subunit [Oscillospiraceae bacterium]
MAKIKIKRLPQKILSVLFIIIVAVACVTYATIVNRATELLTINVKMDGNPLLFVKPDSKTTIVVTKDNAVIYFDNNMDPFARHQFDEVIESLQINPYNGNIHLSTSTGNFYTFDSQFNQLDVFNFPGRVIDFDFADEGAFYILTGSGAATPNFYIRKVDAAGNELYSYRTGFATSKVIKVKETAVYCTVDSRVVALDASGEPIWTTTLRSSISGLAYFEDADLIFAIDTKGSIHQINSAGKSQWSSAISQYGMMSVAYNGEQFVLAADSDGAIFMMDVEGNVILTQQLDSRVSDIYVTDEGNFEVSCSSGQFYTVHSGAIMNTSFNETLGVAIVWGSVALGIAALVLLAYSYDKSAAKASWMLKEMKKSRLGYIMLFPAIALLLIFRVYPVGAAFMYSFMRYTIAMPPKFIGFDNYIEMLTDEYLIRGIGNMLLFLFTDIIKTFTMPLLAAELVFWLHKEKSRHRLRTTLIIPTVVPGVVATLLWRNIYSSDMGLLNNVLRLVRLDGLQRSWLGDSSTAIWSLIFMGIPWVGAFAFLVYFGGLISIPSDIYDAAKIDGANVMRRFIHIDSPMLIPQYRILLFFTYIGSLQSFQSVMLMTRGGPGGSTYVPAYQMYVKLSDQGNYGYASAVGVVLFAVVLIGTILNQSLLKKRD